jgi:hypothetical protein
MYCMDNCLDLKLCRKAIEGTAAQEASLMTAVDQLRSAVADTNASLDNCFVFTLENRNSLMHRIADVKEQANNVGCSYLLELCALTEIITMVLFRSHHYRDRQGLEQIEQAVQQMQFCCSAKPDETNRIAETVDCLWRWVDMNTLPGVQLTSLQA